MAFLTGNPVIDFKPDRGPQILYMDDGVAVFHMLAGSPEGAIAANAGSFATTRGGEAYLKTTDTVATGWIQINAISPSAFVRNDTPGQSVLAPFTVDGTPDIILDDGAIDTSSGNLFLNTVPIKPNGFIVGYARTLRSELTQVPTVTTMLTTLDTYDVPTNILAGNGDFLDYEYGGRYVPASGATRQLSSLVAGTIIHDSIGNLQDLGDAGGLYGWNIKGRIARISSTSITLKSTLTVGFLMIPSAGVAGLQAPGGVLVENRATTLAVADLSSNTLNLLVTGQAGAGGTGGEIDKRQAMITATQMS